MADRTTPPPLSYAKGALPSTLAPAPVDHGVIAKVTPEQAYSQAARRDTPVDPGLTAPTGFGARMRQSIARFLLGSDIANPWFGAGQPLPPVAQEQAKGRAFDFQPSINILTRPRANEPVTFEQLRAIADNYDLLSIVIETRKDQLEKLDWSIQLKADDNRQRPAPDDRAKEIAKFFKRPDRVTRWGTWLRALLDDLLKIDAPAIYARRDRAGRLYALELVDGATIKRLIDQNTGRTPGPDEPCYQQVLHGVPAVDYTRPTQPGEKKPEQQVIKYIRPQRDADNIRKDDSGLPLPELIYAPRNMRTYKLYGFSPVEQILMTVNIGLRHQISQLEYFTAGNVPDAFVAVPESWGPDLIKEAQTYWDSITLGQQQIKRQVRFVPTGTYTPTREAQLKGEFDEWLARVICFTFSISPTAFIRQVNRATAESQKQQALEEGLVPWMKWVKDLIDEIIELYWGYDDIEFVWDDQRDVDPATKATIDVAYVTAGVLTKDEVRSDLGLGPLEQPEGPQQPGLPGAPQTDELGNPLPPHGAGPGGLAPLGHNGGPPMGDGGDDLGKRFIKSFVQASGPTTGLTSYDLDPKAKRTWPGAGWLRRRYAATKTEDVVEKVDTTQMLSAAIRAAGDRRTRDPFDPAAGGSGAPAVTPSPIAKADARDPLDRIAAAHEDNLANRLASAMEQVGTAANSNQAEGQQVLHLIPAKAEVETRIARALDPLLRIFNLGARQASNDNPPIDTGTKTVRFSFDAANPATAAAARDHQITLAGQLADDVVARVQQVVAEGVAAGQPPAVVARQIREVVGLTDGQAAAVDRYRQELQAGDAGALGRVLRDARYDKAVQAAVDGTKALSDDQVDTIAGRYADRLRAHRAMTIARTESLRAANRGAREAMRQAAARGEFGNRAVRRFWLTAPDEKVCPVCSAIPKLNPDGVGLDEDFDGPDGPVGEPPDPHPGCRCGQTFKTVPSDLEGDAESDEGA